MSTLYTDNIRANNASNITMPAGQTLIAPGHTIQYATSVSTNTLNTQSSSYADLPGMSITFTPKASNSHLLFIVTTHIFKQQSPNWQSAGVKVYRGDGTSIMNEGSYGQGANYADNTHDRHMEYVTRHFFAVLSSAAAVTYTVKGAKIQGAGDGQNMVFNNTAYGDGGRLTIMEIAQ